MLTLLDWTLFLGHVCLILFNMVGWIWKKTRVWHLVTMSLTAFSWFVLGAIYGWGYCFCTDYHAEILRKLGHPDADATFIQLLFKRLFRISLSQSVADNLTIVVFALIVVATVIVWTRQWSRRRGTQN
jgi:hypothetical protein